MEISVHIVGARSITYRTIIVRGMGEKWGARSAQKMSQMSTTPSASL